MSSILRSSPGNRILIYLEPMIFWTEFSWFGKLRKKMKSAGEGNHSTILRCGNVVDC
jgi:hypothetical protein